MAEGLRRAAFLTPGRDLGTAVNLVRHAELHGYESVWVTHGLGRDSFLVLAAYGAATTRLGLGVGVLPIYPRHPVATAQAALTLSELSGGRFILGLGVSHRSSMEQMLGLPLTAPLDVMREYVAVLRGALAEGATFDGRHFTVRWSVALPTRPPAPRIFLAALSRRMCELAGEIADGAVLWLCPPSYVRDVALPAIERGRRRANKTLTDFEVVAAVPLAVTSDRSVALDVFRGELVRYVTLPFYRTMLEAAGLGDALAAFDRSGEVPVALADQLGAVGDEAAARAYVAAYEVAGVTLPAIRPIAFPDAPWYRGTLEAASGR